jgi:pimeloyl-ACP methyl ester carboxylesterase
MMALGHERAILIGHSLGGGVVLQFDYQFPDRGERLVLRLQRGHLDPVLAADVDPAQQGDVAGHEVCIPRRMEVRAQPSMPSSPSRRARTGFNPGLPTSEASIAYTVMAIFPRACPSAASP